jgi:hypothetical protein
VAIATVIIVITVVVVVVFDGAQECLKTQFATRWPCFRPWTSAKR